ncbi:MAG TPA: hypothetical protein PKV82_15785, partial [Anaerolineae bacterium]|nr:hypothetical protein [Anaerolineae bacterium]
AAARIETEEIMLGHNSCSFENRGQRVSNQQSAKKRESEKARKITCVAKGARTSVCAQAIISICGGVLQKHGDFSENQRISESLAFTRGHVRTFTREHVHTFLHPINTGK